MGMRPKTISLDNHVSDDDARIFRRSNSGNDMQPVSSREKTGRIFQGSMGRAKGLTQICSMVLLGGSVSIYPVPDIP